MKRWSALRLAASGLAALCLTSSARADEPPIRVAEPPTQFGARYSRYEQDSIDRAVARLGVTVEPSPQGKVIEDISIVPLDVFEKRDFMPTFVLGLVNWFHVTTRPYVIAREVLLAKGQRWEQALVDETARNLRGLGKLSVVLTVPIRSAIPGHVKLLVITKDVWSLRLNSDYLVAGGKLQYLLLQPSEENFLGTHQAVLANFILDPATYTFGGRYLIPRLAGSRIQLDASANVILNRASGVVEGGYGTFSYGQPLYSTRAPWAWGARISVRKDIKRRFVGGELAAFDAEATPGEDAIPNKYSRDAQSGIVEVVRSLGIRTKHNLSAGLRATRNVYRPPDLSAFEPAAQREFIARAMPVSDTQIGPYLEYHTFQNRFATLLDVNTLGLQEDYLAGHDAYLRLTPVTTALGSSRSFLGVYAALAYTVPMGDGLARAYVESFNELSARGVPDGSIDVGLRLVTPRTVAGRLHFDARFLSRYQNYLNARSTLGGDTRPRGYPSQAFFGKDVVAASLEFRSRAVQILGCQLAGAAFLDTGDAVDGLKSLVLKQSAGLGLRVLFPQLDRIVMRVDLGFPFTTCPGSCGPRSEGLPRNHVPDVVLTFRQAFGMPALPAAD